ncbi:MAG: oligosaccharide flippase family protein [Alphaproteobacteria bacterium]|nr:oligosaccharide flippase family protein [Alphaproteobacteria bacterium]
MGFQTILDVLPAQLRGRVTDLVKGDGDTARSGRNALEVYAIRVLSAGIAFLSHIILARWLGAHEFGIFTYVWIWVVVVGSIGAIGFDTTVLRFVQEYQTKGALAELRGFLHVGRLIAFGIGALSAGAGIGLITLWPDAIDQQYRMPLVLALCCVPAFALMDYLDGVGRSQFWMRLALLPPYILRPALIFAFFGLAVTAGLQKNAEIAVMAAIAATWSACLVQYLLQRRALAKIIPAGTRAYKLSFWVSVSLPVLMLDAFELLMTNLDILLLQLYVAPDQIAIYFAAARSTALIAFVQFAVTAAFLPRIAAAFAKNDYGALSEFLRTGCKWTFWPSLAGTLVLVALGKPLLWLFGPEFTAGYLSMCILLVGIMARAAAGPSQGVLVLTGRQKAAAVISFGTLIVNAGLNLVLIPAYGLTGAAIATSVAFGLESLAALIVANRAIRHAVEMDETRGRNEQLAVL